MCTAHFDPESINQQHCKLYSQHRIAPGSPGRGLAAFVGICGIGAVVIGVSLIQLQIQKSRARALALPTIDNPIGSRQEYIDSPKHTNDYDHNIQMAATALTEFKKKPTHTAPSNPQAPSSPPPPRAAPVSLTKTNPLLNTECHKPPSKSNP